MDGAVQRSKKQCCSHHHDPGSLFPSSHSGLASCTPSCRAEHSRAHCEAVVMGAHNLSAGITLCAYPPSTRGIRTESAPTSGPAGAVRASASTSRQPRVSSSRQSAALLQRLPQVEVARSAHHVPTGWLVPLVLCVLSVVLECPWRPPAVHAQLAPGQRPALVDLFLATNGPSSWASSTGWADYASGADPCAGGWYGVTCSGGSPNNVMYVLWTEGFVLQAEAAERNCWVYPWRLRFLSMFGKSAQRPCCLSIQRVYRSGQTRAHRSLGLSSNRLSGTIPPSIGNLTALAYVLHVLKALFTWRAYPLYTHHPLVRTNSSCH